MINKALFQKTVTPLLGKALGAYTNRHKTIAANIANVEVPDYNRRTLAFEEELKEALSVNGKGLSRTHPKHMPVRSSLDDVRGRIDIDRSEPKLNAVNNVDIDHETAAMAQNQLNFNTLATTLRMEYQRIRMAIRGQ